MAPSEVARRVEHLRAEISRHDRLYYVQAAPEISDREYDRLLEELKQLEAEHPELHRDDSPTQRIGDQPVAELQQVRHRIPMLSIDNTYSLAELQAYFKRTEKALSGETYAWVLEYKVDGVAASLLYERGQLVRGVTRGNGVVGDDITHNVRTIHGVPLALNGNDIPPVLEVRGEIYMTNRDLEELNLRQVQSGLPAFKNTRNVTAGTIRMLDPRITASRRLRFLCHGVGYAEGLKAATHMEFLSQAAEMGIAPTPHVRALESSAEVLEAIGEIEAGLHELDFEVDGLVIKIDRFDLRERLGATSKSPRWVIAYKFEKYEATTRLERIDVQVGKTGTVTPVAHLRPVEIAQTTVSRASLHNRDEIERLEVRPGDWVVVEKAGKIIPHIVRVEKHRRDSELPPFRFPSHCPECDSQLMQDPGGVYIRCTNPACPAQLRQRLRFFAGRSGMDIDGLGEKVIDQLVDADLVHNYDDLYRLRKDQLLQLERFGDRKAEKLLEGIERSRDRGLSRVLTAVAIRHVGTRVAQLLTEAFPDIDRLSEASEEELAAVPEIGPIIARSVRQFLTSDHGRATLQGLREVGVRLSETSERPADRASGPLAGKSIVVTGTLQNFTREAIEAKIESLGGRATRSVSRNTDLVVAGENAGSKKDKAIALGIRLVSEEEFQAMIT